MTTTCKLYKVTLSSDRVEGPNEMIFWAYHLNEAKARDAALRWGEAEHPGALISITKVDLIK